MKRKIKKANKPASRKMPKKLANAVKQKIKEDAFWDGDKNVNADDARVINPSRYDVQSEVSSMDSFRDFARESRGNSLTYGDY